MRVIIESPYAARPGKWPKWFDRWMNRRYARKCMKHSLSLGEAPYASHLLYTQVLNDGDQDQRMKGIKAGTQWMRLADLVVVYKDRGITKGMLYGVQEARKSGIAVEERVLWQRNLYRYRGL